MKVSMVLYGDRAKEVARLLGLYSKKEVELAMTGVFKVKNVAGRTVVAATFTGNENLTKTFASEQLVEA